MSDTSTHLNLPYIAPAQAQKHVTHNEALQILDGVVQLSVAGRALADPPVSPQADARHIVAAPATGAWLGQEDNVARWIDGGWTFLTPVVGWRAWVEDEALEVVWQDGSWQPLRVQSFDNLDRLGVNATADAGNRLAVASAASLFNHEGAGHQLKINKAVPGDTASLLFQTAFSGRAEMGLAGNDAWSIKVSADGSAWTNAITFDPATGLATGAAVQSDTSDVTQGRLMRTGAFGLGADGLAVDPAALDQIDAGGLYTLTAEITGVLDVGASVMHMQQNATTAAQIGVHGTSDVLQVRRKEGGIWQDWQEIFSQASLLGPVSQVGGVPTGAVIERGSNANGEYTRFSDGTQICMQRLTLGPFSSSSTSHGLYRSSARSFSHAVNFANGSRVYASGGGGDLFPNGLLHSYAANTTHVFVRVASLQAFIDENAGDVHVTSIGRWF